MASAEALFAAWHEFRRGKTERKDVLEFGRHVERNIFRLHRELVSRRYKHSAHDSFFIHDPKVRHIRKAQVRDRIISPLHQGIDFLGYVTLPHHRVLRTKTGRRMRRKLSERLKGYFDGATPDDSMNQTLQSYLGMLSHADTHKLQEEIKNTFCWR